MEYVEAIGCLSQRSRLDRLQALADAWTRDQLSRAPAGASSATLIALAEGGRELVHDLPFSGTARPGTLDGLIPQQGILRILREGDATAAALIATRSHDLVGLQIADLDHEESLTARILRSEPGHATIDRWDLTPFHWPLRLRQLLRGARGPAAGAAVTRLSTSTSHAAAPMPSARPAPVAATVRARESAPGRRSQVRELREQLGQPPPAAPSWLQ
jgi:hypothetical protein